MAHIPAQGGRGKAQDGPPVVLHPWDAGAGGARWRCEGGEGQALHAGATMTGGIKEDLGVSD